MDLGVYPTTRSNQTPNTMHFAPGVSPRAIMFAVKRETTQTIG